MNAAPCHANPSAAVMQQQNFAERGLLMHKPASHLRVRRQCGDDAELAVDGVRRRQHPAGRLLAQHILVAAGLRRQMLSSQHHRIDRKQSAVLCRGMESNGSQHILLLLTRGRMHRADEPAQDTSDCSGHAQTGARSAAQTAGSLARAASGKHAGPPACIEKISLAFTFRIALCGEGAHVAYGPLRQHVQSCHASHETPST